MTELARSAPAPARKLPRPVADPAAATPVWVPVRNELLRRRLRAEGDALVALAICLGLFGGCALSAFLPLMSAEALVLSGAALAPHALALPLAVAAALGQMTGKTALFLASRGALQLPRGRLASRLEGALARASRFSRPTAPLLFVSAAIGLPPFYLTTISSGLLRMRISHFLILGGSGCFLRFATLVFLPQLAALIRS